MPLEDEASSKLLERAFRRRKIAFELGSRFSGVQNTENGVKVSLENGKEIEAELLLVAVGRGPVSQGLGYEEAGVAMDRGYVLVDELCRTNVPTISAVGDLIPTLQLAHVGFGEGILVAERVAGLDPAPIDYAGVPRITYSDPEVASVGLTEAQAKEKYGEVKTLTYDLAGNGRSQILKTAGAVKLIASPEGPVVGIHMVGSRVGELIAEAQLIYNWEARGRRRRQPHPPAPDAERGAGRGPPRPRRQAPARARLIRSHLPASTPARRSTAPMPTSVTMPALGESVTEGTVTRWLKQEGEQVEVDEPLLEVSTDKVDTEIPSPAAGVLTKILVAEDETVEVGAELAVIGGDAGDGDGGGSRRRPRRPRTPTQTQTPDQQVEDAGSEPAEQPAQEAPAPAGSDDGGSRRRRRWRRGHLGDHAGAGRERHRGHGHPLAEGRRRRGRRPTSRCSRSPPTRSTRRSRPR